ncbi:MAG: glycosyltransferase family 4 protein [Planctomycetes bacterium]|nr:glycosyltransferase family 4 protein [Planctomycetota bacterium]
MRIAIITAGGAGMYCGSCLHDNTLAAALLARGTEVQLIPTYTPIRTDEEDVSLHRVFLGGINVYLQQKARFWSRVPRAVRRVFDAPWILGKLGSLGLKTDPAKLGELTLSMLRGELGRQRDQLQQLATFLAEEARPDIVLLSNMLLAGLVEPLKRRWAGPVLCLLQGDDIFLEGLPEPYRSEARRLLQGRVREFDGFLIHSFYYRDFMADYLGIPAHHTHIVPLGLNLIGYRCLQPSAQRSALSTQHSALAESSLETHDSSLITHHSRFTVGYFARICPEKGLHVLVEAFDRLRGRDARCQLRVAGYLGARDRAYFRGLCRQARRGGWNLEYAGALDRPGKIRFLESLDVLSVPTVYREPKGLYVLEALASGVPVVQPQHGAFPELLEATGGGLLVKPGDPESLADALDRLRRDPLARRQFAAAGQATVRERFNADVMAESTLAVLRQYVEPAAPAAKDTATREQVDGRPATAPQRGALAVSAPKPLSAQPVEEARCDRIHAVGSRQTR